MDVKTYLEKFKNNIKIVMSRKKTIKKFFRKMNNIRKEYLKTVTKKQFEKEKKGFLKELTTNTRYVELAKCSFDKCLKLHKKGLVLVKNLTDKLCKKRKYSKGL